MPELPLPTGETWIGGGDLPVSEPNDVLKEFPSTHRRPKTAPVRDAFVEGFTEGFKEYQNQAAYAAAQTDPMRATGIYLASFAEEHTVVPRVGESEESVRSRLFRAPQIISYIAIVDGVNEIIAPYTFSKATLAELELDGWFIHDGTNSEGGEPVWDSFVGAPPEYPDRHPLPLINPNPQLSVPGAVPSRGYPRSFVLYVPELFIANADAIYSQIIGFVESVKGQGISWSMVIG